MKLQQINRGKSQYYHVYLPKNIVEHVLQWHQSDNLEYKVINNSLILKRVTQPVNKYLEELSCPICYNHCVIIKAIKHPKRNEYVIVSRCPQDHSVIKKSFQQTNLAEWKWYIHETINICDICGGPLEEQIRKHSKSIIRAYFRLKFICRDCGRIRVKVIADTILTSESPPSSDIKPLIVQKNRDITNKTPPSVCPICQEEVVRNAVFCGQCGSFLISSEF